MWPNGANTPGMSLHLWRKKIVGLAVVSVAKFVPFRNKRSTNITMGAYTAHDPRSFTE
ncbi:hypothetical protein FA15DRAFT_666524 [Coprinopsis marcescibilis]|uniref:Uncharacterized protein n=1 Tax=Coprinopsis marcescibilis TaxID=230819 RepID=A0A5C3LFF9_COPMA|nr:hypothetical protein FA15DRAFT_666524 [Coprinopsis marcescibilis]